MMSEVLTIVRIRLESSIYLSTKDLFGIGTFFRLHKRCKTVKNKLRFSNNAMQRTQKKIHIQITWLNALKNLCSFFGTTGKANSL